MHSSLASFKVLIIDSDIYLSNIAKAMLKAMGFNNIQITTSGTAALELIKNENFDFVITEWKVKDLDGMSLIKHIRHSPDSPNPTLPIMMLTGHKEQLDVQAAREFGVHEYVLKPFTSQTIYNRLERMIDMPRYFVVGGSFVGPDRRHRQADGQKSERRKTVLTPQRKPLNPVEVISKHSAPELWLPDYSMKHKLGGDIKLESIITPAILNQAQSVIGVASDAAINWIKQDMQHLQTVFNEIKKRPDQPHLVGEAVETAVTISSRSGTFGYAAASKIAYQLYIFLRRNFEPRDPNHFKATTKYMDVMEFIFAHNLHNDESKIIDLAKELNNLTEKYTKLQLA